MSRYLLIDVGAGTMDILYADDASGLQYKAVVRSPVLTLAEKARALSGNLAVSGVEMGGGPVTRVLQERAGEREVVMSAAAAATLHHDLRKVEAWGIRVVKDSEIKAFQDRPDFNALVLGDIEPDRLQHLVEGFGVPFRFDVIGFCAQDHGVAPPGESHLDHRHRLFQERLDRSPFPEALLYEKREIPETFSRLRSAARLAEGLPAGEIYVMDSGMAAILGASLDRRCLDCRHPVVLDVATSHTVAAVMEGGRIAGFFEIHTRDITAERMDSAIRQLADGELTHQRVLSEGGHGAYIRRAVGFEAVDIFLLTGPKRDLMRTSTLPVTWGAPFGDNMMTGTAGLLAAIRRRKGLGDLLGP